MEEAPTNAIEEVVDETPKETIVEASLTSHLRNVTVPAVEKTPEQVEEELPSVKLPKTVKLTIEALREARKENDVRTRRYKVSTLSQHLHAISQGTPAPQINGKVANNLAISQNRAAEEIQIEMIGRQFPVVKKFIGELKAENESLTKELNALKK